MSQFQLIQYLEQFISSDRLAIFDKVLEQRTRYITVMLEDIYHSQNASAVLRTCDCFGIQDVHIVENCNEYNINPDVTLGSNKWLNLNYYNEEEDNTLKAINHLKGQGYRIVATSPHINDVELQDFDYAAGKIALVFGTEQDGISEVVRDNADEFLKIPMFGFTESFNISVSAAICLHHLVLKLKSSAVDWKLCVNEMEELKVDWLKKSIKRSELLVERYYNE